MNVTVNARLELKYSTYTWTGDFRVDNAEQAIVEALDRIQKIQTPDGWRRVTIDVYNGDIE